MHTAHVQDTSYCIFLFTTDEELPDDYEYIDSDYEFEYDYASIPNRSEYYLSSSAPDHL